MELFSGIGERAPQGPLGDKNKTRDIQGLKNKSKKLYGRTEGIEIDICIDILLMLRIGQVKDWLHMIPCCERDRIKYIHKLYAF